MAVATEVVARFTADISDVQSKMAGVRGAFDAVSDAASFSSSQIRNVGQTMADVGTKMTVGITLPLAGVAAAATNAAMSFETSMTKIIGLVGIASDEVGRMGEEVLAMSGAVGKAPDELAAGLFVVTSAGLRGSEAMAVLGNSARAGAAGLGETNDIARAVAGALSAYGSDVLSAAAATDAIVATARAGNFETSQFAAAIGRVLPFAQQAGASFQEMGGAVALLTRVNGDAAQSVTQIQALFRAFVVPTEEAKTALEEMGMSAQDLRDSIAKKGLPATLQMLDRALGGNREQLGRILGSSEAASAAFQILEADAATIAETFGVVADSSGMTAEAFGAVANTTQFQVNQAMAELKATLIDLGNQFLPIVKSVMDFAKAHLTAFNSLPGPVKTFITVMAGIVAVIGPLLLIVGKLIVVFSTLLSLMLKTKAIGALRAAFVGLRGELAASRASIQRSQTSIGMLGTTAQTAKIAVVTSFRAIGVAAKGLLASLGPIGWALAAAGVAFEVFAGNAAGTQNAVENLKNEIDATTGAMTEMGRQWIGTELTTNISKEDWAMLSKYGITIGGFIDALEEGGPAIAEYEKRILSMLAGQDGLLESFNGTAMSAQTIAATLRGMIGYYDESKSAAEAMALGQEAAATATTMTDASMVAAAKSASTMSYGMRAGGVAADELAAAAELAEQEIAQMRTEMELWLSGVSQISAVDAAAASIDNIGKASVEFGTNLMGQTPKARDFRGAVVQAFEDSANAAATLSDDLPTQRSIFTGELIKIVASLRKSGVKPKDIEAFLGAMDDLPASVSDIMRSAAKAVGDTDFKTEVEKAFDKSVKAGAPMTADAMERLAEGASGAAKAKLGLTLEPELASIIKSGTTALRPTAFNNGKLTGQSIGSGAAYGINQSSPIVIAAVERVMAAAKAAADAAVESDSPSRLFAETGDDIVAGLAMGITRSTRAGVAVMSEAARQFTRAFMQAFMPRDMGVAESAIANAVEEATQKLRDARSRLRDATRGVRDAERALNQARKDGDADSITRAERDLARARKAATNAADAVKVANWVKANGKALAALQGIARQYDYIVGKMDGVKAAFSRMSDLLATPLGTASDLSQMFQLGTDPRTLARNYMSLADTVREAYAVLTDPAIVGASAAGTNTAAMNATIGQLESYVTRIMALQNEYSANAERMRVNEEKWRIDEAALRDALTASTRVYEDATRELERIVNERGGFITNISNGFRSFVNSLSGLTRESVSTVTEQVRDLGNGVRVIVRSTQQEMQGGAGAIADALRSRLDDVRAFSRNVQSLMRRGLDPSLVRDFIESGVSSAGDTVAALASATDDELRSINDTQAELLRYAQEFATGVGDAYYSSAISAQEAIVRDTKAAVDAAQKALDDAKAAYDAERGRLAAEQTRIESDISTLVTQIEALITNTLTSLVPATEAAAQASIDAMIAQFQRDFPKVSKELNRLMDALVKSMERTVRVAIEPVRTGATSRANVTTVADVPATMTVGGAPAPAANVTYQITVNAGVGDPREIGRVTVDAITAYERSSGRVFARA